MTATTIATSTATAPRRTALVARLRAALAHPGFLTGLAALAMYGGAPTAVLPVKVVAERR